MDLEATNLLAILASAKQLSASIVTPISFMNVYPKSNPGGIIESGMSPAGIRDPKARADYERRIELNNAAAEERGAALGLRSSIERSELAVVLMLRHFKSVGNEAALKSFKAAIEQSPLSEQTKLHLLASEPASAAKTNGTPRENK